MSVTDLGLLRFIPDERDLILISGDASSRIGVDNRDYHHLSQNETNPRLVGRGGFVKKRHRAEPNC